jgi:hypothetical protein
MMISDPVREAPGDAGKSLPAPKPGPRQWSLRLRIGAWTVGVFILTLAAFTVAGILEDRRQLLRVESARASRLLEHLSRMPDQWRGNLQVDERMKALNQAIGPFGGDIEILPAGVAAGAPSPPPGQFILAQRALQLSEGDFLLRATARSEDFAALRRRSIRLHLLHGLFALAALMAGTEWILRRNLIVPLEKIVHQLKRMGSGGGWWPVVPPADAELEGLGSALQNLGPELAKQVGEWMRTERASAVALAFNKIQIGLQEPVREARVLASELEARDLMLPEGKRKLRALLLDVERIVATLHEEERRQFGGGGDEGAAEGNGGSS